MKTHVTRGIMQDVDPADYARHRYGLSPRRWEALRGRDFWVTGAGTGYGRCIAVALASAGARVFLTGRTEHKLHDSLAEMKALGISPEHCHILPADITSEQQILDACGKVQAACASLYGLVHCAALPPQADLECPFQDGALDDWNRIMATNVTGPWLLTRSIFPHMQIGGQARILLFSSGAGWAFTPGFGPYNVSKAALNSLGASLAAELEHTHPDIDIQCNVLDPGEARTEMNTSATDSPYRVVSMALTLLSHPPGGPNGMFFHRDGRHLESGVSGVYPRSLTSGE